MFIALILVVLLGGNEGGGSTAGLTLPSDAVYYDESDAKKVRFGRDYYPPEAKKAKVSGYAVVECEIKPNGKLFRCAVLVESPSGMGFGKATAIKVLKNPPTFPSSPNDAVRRVRYTFRWDYNFKDPITG